MQPDVFWTPPNRLTVQAVAAVALGPPIVRSDGARAEVRVRLADGATVCLDLLAADPAALALNVEDAATLRHLAGALRRRAEARAANGVRDPLRAELRASAHQVAALAELVADLDGAPPATVADTDGEDA